MGKQWKQQRDFLLGGSKITADGNDSHEIKRHLLPGRKAMTNLDSILKTRDITLLTKVRVVKAMVFPVIMCGCESWTIKKVECWRIDAFELWCWRGVLRVPWTARSSRESILLIIWPKYWSFNFNSSPSNEYSGLISFRVDWFDCLAVQGTLKSLCQHHSSNASILWHSAFFMIQLSHPYMTTGKTIALTRRTFVGNLSAF